jgi:Putative peptidoglycan binding domain
MPRVTENPSYGVRELYLGCPKGLDVWNLQVKLIGWGSGLDNDGVGQTMDPVRLTGEFDTTTRDAVLRFQLAHKLGATGRVDGCIFRAIDREAALHPVVMNDLKCPCARGDNDGPIQCRCTGHNGANPPVPNPHKDEGKCDGWGKKRFAGKFLLEGKKIWDGATETSIDDEKLDVYDKEEYEGMDKTVLWAVRAILHRAGIQSDAAYKRITVAAGYRCWHDNYHYTDLTRWHHCQTTFHFGKTIQFTIHGHCSQPIWKDDTDSCPQCNALRQTALEKCGFQSRWQEPSRVSLAESPKTARQPSSPFAVSVDTVRLHEREADGKLNYKDHFVKTDADAAKPLYGGSLVGVSFPTILAPGVTLASNPLEIKWALHPKFASSEQFFRNTEMGKGGYFPIGRSRLWHGGVHLNVDAGAPVYAIADGEVVGCRMGEQEDRADGSRNFVLLRHEIKAGAWKDKVFYSLYMHLDGEEVAADATVRWRRELFQRSKDHVEATVPSPLFELETVDAKGRLFPKPGLTVGEAVAVTGGDLAAKDKDDSLPAGWKMYALASPPDHHFVFITRDEGQTMGEKHNALDGVAKGAIIGLERPIKVCAGELLGKVAKAAQGADPFLHLETFAESELPVQDPVLVDASDAGIFADRKAIVAKLVDDAKLLPKPQDGVLIADEVNNVYSFPPYYAKLRSAVVKMPSAWAVDWKPALSGAKSLGFLTDPDALAAKWNDLRWWDGVKTGKGRLPADPSVLYHYHPIALILQLAYL